MEDALCGVKENLGTILAFSDAEKRIIDAYLELIGEKPYEQLTVKEITARCGISRTAFYRSFDDTLDLLERIERYALSRLSLYRARMAADATMPDDANRPSAQGKPYESIVGWFETGLRLRFMLRPIMSRNGDLYFRERLTARVRDELNAMMDDDRAPRDKLRPFYVAAIASTYIGLLEHIVSVEKESELISAVDLANIANSARVAYYRFGAGAPNLSDEILFGRVPSQSPDDPARASDPSPATIPAESDDKLTSVAGSASEEGAGR